MYKEVCMSDEFSGRSTLNTNILYVHYGENWLRGSEIVLLDLLQAAKSQHQNVLLWCNSDVLADKARSLGVEVIEDRFVCLGYWTLPKWDFRQFFKLLRKAKKLIREHGISLVHCNNGAPCQWMAPICKLTKIPLLLHLHARYMFRDRLTLLFHGADNIIGVSQAVINIFKSNEFNQQSIGVIYNGINENRILSAHPRDIRAETSASKQDFVMLYVGSLIKRKGVDQLLYAVAKLKAAYPIKLAIVGSGSEEDELRKLAGQLQLEKQVKFFPNSENVANWYSSNADCFISVPSEEVFGLTLAESSIAKLPVITTNIPGVNEIYQDKKHALLVPPKDTTALINAIKRLINSETLRAELAQTAHDHIKENFSLAHQYQSFRHAYHSLSLASNKQKTVQRLFLHCITLLKALVNKSYQSLLVKFSWEKRHD